MAGYKEYLRRLLQLIGFSLWVAGFNSQLLGQSRILNIDFGVDSVLPAAQGAAAIGADGDFWNLYSRPGAAVGVLNRLLWNDRSESGASVQVANGAGAWVTDSTNLMMKIYLYNSGGAITTTLTNLPAGTYDLLAYGRGAGGPLYNSVFRVQYGTNITSPQATGTAGGWEQGAWAEGVQYVRFASIQLIEGQSITLTASPGSQSVPSLNGLQLLAKLGTFAIDPPSSVFTNRLQLSFVGITPGYETRYTTDGLPPSPTSRLYTGPFIVDAATAVRGQEFNGTNSVGKEASGNYARIYAINDGIPSNWRLRYFGANYLTDPHAAADADPDGDGTTNYQEYLAGTDPLDPQSGFRLEVARAVRLRWPTQAGVAYQILHKNSLFDPEWQVVRQIPGLANSTEVFLVESEPQSGFYAIRRLE